MLNLLPIFEDAIESFSRYESYLKVPPLPATVFLMQCDVINHYRYAVNHYLPLTLNEHFLQNSSIGNPYQKWAKFTNDDFDILSFAVTNLLRYTGRLICETEVSGLEANKQFADSKSRSSVYIAPLVEIDQSNKRIGIYVHENEILSITPFATEAAYEGSVRVTANAGGSPEHFHVMADQTGQEQQRLITPAEYRQLTQTLRPSEFRIHDRTILSQLKAAGLAEIESLLPLNRQFGALCEAYYSNHAVSKPFDALIESWLI